MSFDVAKVSIQIKINIQRLLTWHNVLNLSLVKGHGRNGKLLLMIMKTKNNNL